MESVNSPSYTLHPHGPAHDDTLIPTSGGEPFVDIRYIAQKLSTSQETNESGDEPTRKLQANSELSSSSITVSDSLDNTDSYYQELNGTNKQSNERLLNEATTASDSHLDRDQNSVSQVSMLLWY